MRHVLLVPLLLAAPLALWAQTTVNLKGPDKVTRAYTLKGHPRVWLDGPTGTIALALKDPDGSGPSKSPRATGNAWTALQNRVNSVWDGYRYNGNPAAFAALGWWMDNNAHLSSGKNYLTYVKETFAGLDKHPHTGACDKNLEGCSDPSGVDFMAEMLTDWSLAYTLVRDQLTPAERSDYADKLLNGLTNQDCVNRLERMSGTVTVTASSAVITTMDVDFSLVSVGDYVYVKNASTPGTGGVWRMVASKQSPTQITLSGSLSTSGSRWIYRIKPWVAGTNQCGFAYVTMHTAATPSYILRSAATTLNGSVSQVTPGTEPQTQNISVNSWTGSIPSTTPFYIYVGSVYPSSAEVMKVTAVNGGVLTVVRGEFGQTTAYNSGASVRYYSHTQGGSRVGSDNRVLARHAAATHIALALAGDYSAAASLLETAAAWQADYVQPPFVAFDGTSGHSANSYGPQRLLPNLNWTIWALLQSTAPYGHNTELDFRSSFLKRTLGNYFLHWPNAWDASKDLQWAIQSSDATACAGALKYPNCSMLPIWLQGQYPGTDEAKYVWYWVHNDAASFFSVVNLQGDAGQRGIWPLLLFDSGSLPSTNYKTVLNSSVIWTETDDDATNPDTKWNMFVSRSDWTANATQFTGLFPDHFSDKFYDAYMTYAIGKKGWLIGHTRSYAGDAPGASLMEQNIVDLGPVFRAVVHTSITDTSVTPLQADIRFRLEKSRVTGDYLYALVNTGGVYQPSNNVTHALRHFVHLKSAGQKDYIVVYDDIAKGGATRIRSLIHYLNNGETGEGVTAMNSGGTALSTTNAPPATARLNTVFLIPTGSGIKSFYDLSVSMSGDVATVGSDCTTASPCRANVNGQVYSYSQSSTASVTPPSSGAATVYLWLDPTDGSLNSGYSSGFSVAPVLAGLLVNAGQVSDFPSGAIRLAKVTYNGPTRTSGCPGLVNYSSYGTEMDCCVGNQARVLYMDAGTTAAAEFVAVHRPTLDVTEEADGVSLVGTIDAGYLGLQIGNSSPAIVVLPRAGNTTQVLNFTSPHSGTAQVFVAGLAAGMYEIRRNGGVIDSRAVSEDGTLFFTSLGGEIRIAFSAALPLTITTSGLPTGSVGQSYAAYLSASGGVLPETWSIFSGGLPEGLALDGSTGTIAGTPTTAGESNATVQVTDSSAPPQTASKSFTLVVSAGSLQIVTSSLPAATVGTAYSEVLQASGGLSPYLWSVTGGWLPPGLTLEPDSGLLSGTPTSAGVYTFTVEVSDSSSPPATAQWELSLSVVGGPLLSIATDSLPWGVVGVPYSATLSASGGSPPYSWTIISGALPTDVALSQEGAISGTPSEDGIANFSVQVSDNSQPPQIAEKGLVIFVTQPGDPVLRLEIQGVTSRRGLVRYGKPGLSGGQSCTVQTSLDATFQDPVESLTDSGGPAIRERVVGETSPLAPAAPYYLRVNCGAGIQTRQLLTAAASTPVPRMVRASFDASLIPGADHVVVEYGASPALGQSQSTACVNRCVVYLPAQSDTILYLRHTYKNTSNQVVAAGSVAPVIVR